MFIQWIDTRHRGASSDLAWKQAGWRWEIIGYGRQLTRGEGVVCRVASHPYPSRTTT